VLATRSCSITNRILRRQILFSDRQVSSVLKFLNRVIETEYHTTKSGGRLGYALLEFDSFFYCLTDFRVLDRFQIVIEPCLVSPLPVWIRRELIRLSTFSVPESESLRYRRQMIALLFMHSIPMRLSCHFASSFAVPSDIIKAMAF